ncbi:MAG: recombination protein RecR [Deltaproteobacteria bacterium]|jgi:recombination protein RecR|nr:recombination protein RecR [Deltaproteobacteria bacterium]MBW2554071.1 recombination protein RecR [Deltaproteobacteria bacterium]MCK5514747.1 recombination protein RecR [Deltaproteobacteria bacterium]NOQ86187.1 recombination protein RecR [Deltaproteobacteria bacterium]
MTKVAEPINQLIKKLAKLPGVGGKTASRLALYILRSSKEEAYDLARSIVSVKEKITFCSVCYNLTDENPCNICKDEKRDKEIICVVEEPGDLMALESSGEFKGKYHVLFGVISPLDGVTPDDIKVQELLERLNNGQVKEVIVATNPTTNGNATALYLSNLIKPLGIKVTRIAQGIPIGGDIEYTDEVTLRKAMEGRRDF